MFSVAIVCPMFHYFAYGSVLSLDHAREWCLSHGLDVEPFLAGRPARLDGYRLVFDVPSRYWAGLGANIEPSPGNHVEGVVFTLDDDVRLAVHRKEGVATGLYREESADVSFLDGVTRAFIYRAEPTRRVAPGPASARYLESLIAGARERGLSVDWQAQLRRFSRDDGAPPPPGVTLGLKK